jgi:putative FmdB family regulatory protein
MPLYDYKCNNCDTIEEKLVNHSDVVVICELCDNVMERQISCFGLAKDGKYLTKKKQKEQAQNVDMSKGITIKQPIIKDRNTGKTLYGPEIG